MYHPRVAVLLATVAVFYSTAALSEEVRWADRLAIGMGVGTNGIVAEGSYKLSSQLILRAQAAFIDFDDSFKSSDVKYSGHLRFNTGGGFVDLHPWSNPWMLSAGAVSGDRRVDLKATPSVSGTIKIHGQTFPLTEVGEVDGSIDFGSPAPFVGFGWDNTFYTGRHFGFRAVAGVVLGDSTPGVSLHAVGPFASDPVVLSDISAEQSSLQRDSRDYRYYPVVQLGVNYRF